MNEKIFLKSAMKFCVTPIVSTIIAIVIIPLVSRIYSTTDFGYISNFYSLGNLLLYMFLLGLDGAYTRYYYEPPNGVDNGKISSFTIFVGVIITLLVGLFTFAVFPQKVSILFFNDKNTIGLLFLFLYVASLIVFTIINLSVRFDENAKVYNRQQVVLLICTRLIYVAAALFTTKYIYSVALMTFSTTIMTCFIFYIRRKKLLNSPFIPFKTIKVLMTYALPIMPTTVFVQLNSNIAKLLLGGFGFRKEVGVLALATSVANVFTIIPKIFTTYWGPFIFKYYKTDQKIIKNIHSGMMMVSLLLIISILLFQDFFFLIVGESYKSSQRYFMLIMLAPVSVLVSETTNYGVNLAKKPIYNLIITVIVCIINVTICLLMIPKYGELGAVLGIAVAAIANGTLKTISGQYFYSTINNIIQTIQTSILIIVLCILNMFCWNLIIIRIAISFISLFVCYIIYNKEISRIIHSFIRTKDPIR